MTGFFSADFFTEFFEIPIVLVVNDSVHAHSSDNVTLTKTYVLSVDDAVHAHSSDNVSLTQTYVLSVDDAVHGHSSDNVNLTQTHILSVDDAVHAHFSDSCVLTVGSISIETISINEVQADCIIDQSRETNTRVLSQVQINGIMMNTANITSSVQSIYSIASEVLP